MRADKVIKNPNKQEAMMELYLMLSFVFGLPILLWLLTRPPR